jgi:hypothetical protein
MNIESTLETLRKEPPQKWFAKDCKKELQSVVKNMIPAAVDPKVTFG